MAMYAVNIFVCFVFYAVMTEAGYRNGMPVTASLVAGIASGVLLSFAVSYYIGEKALDFSRGERRGFGFLAKVFGIAAVVNVFITSTIAYAFANKTFDAATNDLFWDYDYISPDYSDPLFWLAMCVIPAAASGFAAHAFARSFLEGQDDSR